MRRPHVWLGVRALDQSDADGVDGCCQPGLDGRRAKFCSPCVGRSIIDVQTIRGMMRYQDASHKLLVFAFRCWGPLRLQLLRESRGVEIWVCVLPLTKQVDSEAMYRHTGLHSDPSTAASSYPRWHAPNAWKLNSAQLSRLSCCYGGAGSGPGFVGVSDMQNMPIKSCLSGDIGCLNAGQLKCRQGG